MKKENDNQRYIADLIDQLTAEKLSIIDFDKHRQWLSDLAAMLNAHEQQIDELQLLRDDYIDRISGMVKAIAAARSKEGRMEQAMDFLDELPSLSALELTKQYRRISAIFRDSFPISYGRFRTGAITGPQYKLSELK